MPRATAAELPLPPTALQRHSAALAARIQQEIELTDGWIGFDRYMQLALYQPGQGYYVSGLQKFGEEGDFVTAPEIGGLFAACVGRQCAQILGSLKEGVILEFGAGSGALAAGVMDYLSCHESLPRRYLILEPSVELRARQRQTIEARGKELLRRVKWLDRLPSRGLRGVVLANEVLDAMPAVRFLTGDDGSTIELGVANSESGFEWALSPRGRVLPQEYCARIGTTELGAGYAGEISLQAEAWVATVGALLDEGLMLLIDYGFSRREFYHPDRRTGTLMCHYRHKAHGNPFLWPGLQDITVHIDFTALAEAGRRAGLELLGYASQGAFLMSLGIIDLVPEGAMGDVDQLTKTQEIKKLTLPHEMGELFKVIALGRDLQQPLSGFQIQNWSDRL